MKVYELTPASYDRVKSYYGKAKVIELDNGEMVLQSYIHGFVKSRQAANLSGYGRATV